MKDLIDKYSWEAIKHDNDGATLEYYRSLGEDGVFRTTACGDCGKVSYPPRPFCPGCFSEKIAWADIGARGASLYSFTTQSRSLRFGAPAVIGIVEIPGVGRILSKINAKLDELTIGQKLKFEPFKVSEKITVHTYTPE